MSYRIVAVDDNPVITGLIAAVLEGAGYEVETAPAAAEALLILQRNPPDLLLLDLQMPGLDGMEALRVLRDTGTCKGVPVIILTGETDAHFVTRARELGAAGYLQKPFKAEALAVKVRRVLENPHTVWLDDYHTVTRAEEDGWTLSRSVPSKA